MLHICCYEYLLRSHPLVMLEIASGEEQRRPRNDLVLVIASLSSTSLLLLWLVHLQG